MARMTHAVLQALRPSGLILFATLVLGTTQAQVDKDVSDAEKKEFLKLLTKLPTRGEFFTAEAIKTAIPHTRVLLGLTEKDLEKYELYPLFALSRGLVDQKEPQQYATKHFNKIAHPTLKLAWATLLLDEKAPSPEIVGFLRKALDTKQDAQTLTSMLGPGFEEFKDRVIRLDEAGKRTRIELVKQHTIKEFPEFGRGHNYTNESYVAAPGPLLYAVRPHKQQGELNIYNVMEGKMRTLVLPQPEGFKPKFDFASYFENPLLVVNSHGDLMCRWTIEGNGDHGLALLKKGAESFVVRRVKKSLDRSYLVSDLKGSWYLIEGGPYFTLYQLDADLNLTALGEFAGKGFHSYGIADARFIAPDVLHLLWGDVIGGNHLRVRCVDFDVKRKRWLHDRELFRLDQFVSSANEPTVPQLKDESNHYFWRIDLGAKQGKATGLYYQTERDGKTVKVTDAYDYRAVAVGNRIVVCYTKEDTPEKVFFCVIHQGLVGPKSELIAAKGREHNLWAKYMFLYADGDRIWFANTLFGTWLYELKLTDAAKP
jgi:hypothetical protein